MTHEEYLAALAANERRGLRWFRVGYVTLGMSFAAGAVGAFVVRGWEMLAVIVALQAVGVFSYSRWRRCAARVNVLMEERMRSAMKP